MEKKNKEKNKKINIETREKKKSFGPRDIG